MEILTSQFPAALSPSSMDPRPAEPDSAQVTLALPGSRPGPGLSADDAAEDLAIGWPPRLPRQADQALSASGPGWQYTPSARPPDLPPQPAGQPRDPQTGRWAEL
jgi:hypothetical protein